MKYYVSNNIYYLVILFYIVILLQVVICDSDRADIKRSFLFFISNAVDKSSDCQA